MSNINHYYNILGLQPGASQAQVKQAYRQLAKAWHPDLFPDNPQLQQKAEAEIKKINQAYEALKSYQPNFECDRIEISSTSVSAEAYYNQGMENGRTAKYSYSQ